MQQQRSRNSSTSNAAGGAQQEPGAAAGGGALFSFAKGMAHAPRHVVNAQVRGVCAQQYSLMNCNGLGLLGGMA